MIQQTLKEQIRKHKSRVFRRAYVKRMLSTGVFESDWVEITDDVKRWGRVTQSIDSERYSKFQFNSVQISVNNESGLYLSEDDTRSLWYGFASQQRSLLKIEAGYVNVTLGADGIYAREETPGSMWDVAYWDDPGDTYDQKPVIFTGIISGDIMFSDRYEVNLNVMPIMEVFRTFPARNLTGYTSTGMTASQFCNMVRDQTDGAGMYVFRPFLDNTTSSWNVETTTSIYTQLNTSTAADIINMTVWDVIEKLAEAEDFVCFITGDAQFVFRGRNAVTTTAAYEFHGLGSIDRDFGHTIKQIEQFGRKFSKYYSRVSVQFRSDNTTTSFQIVESSLTVSGTNSPWIYGSKTLQVSNNWIAGATQAASLAQNIFDNVNAVRREIRFSTVFVPTLSPLEKVSISYDPSTELPESLWDTNNWGDTTAAALPEDLIWDKSRGDSFYLNNEEMTIVQIELDLDKLETKITAREA